jgi:hypothetical protein
MYCRPPIDGLELSPGRFSSRLVCFPPGRSSCDGFFCDEAPFLAEDVRSGDQRLPLCFDFDLFALTSSKGSTLASRRIALLGIRGGLPWKVYTSQTPPRVLLSLDVGSWYRKIPVNRTTQSHR